MFLSFSPFFLLKWPQSRVCLILSDFFFVAATAKLSFMPTFHADVPQICCRFGEQRVCYASIWTVQQLSCGFQNWNCLILLITHVLQEALVKRCIKRSSSNSSSSRSSRAWSKTALEGTWAVHSMIRQMLVALMIPVHFLLSSRWRSVRSGCGQGVQLHLHQIVGCHLFNIFHYPCILAYILITIQILGIQ